MDRKTQRIEHRSLVAIGGAINRRDDIQYEGCSSISLVNRLNASGPSRDARSDSAIYANQGASRREAKAIMASSELSMSNYVRSHVSESQCLTDLIAMIKQLGEALGKGASAQVYSRSVPHFRQRGPDPCDCIKEALNWTSGETVAIKQISIGNIPEGELSEIMVCDIHDPCKRMADRDDPCGRVRSIF